MARPAAEQRYLINLETGARFKIGGCLISDTSSNLPLFGAARTLSNKQLPPAIDLRQCMTPVENQRRTNSWLVCFSLLTSNPRILTWIDHAS